MTVTVTFLLHRRFCRLPVDLEIPPDQLLLEVLLELRDVPEHRLEPLLSKGREPRGDVLPPVPAVGDSLEADLLSVDCDVSPDDVGYLSPCHVVHHDLVVGEIGILSLQIERS